MSSAWHHGHVVDVLDVAGVDGIDTIADGGTYRCAGAFSGGGWSEDRHVEVWKISSYQKGGGGNRWKVYNLRWRLHEWCVFVDVESSSGCGVRGVGAPCISEVGRVAIGVLWDGGDAEAGATGGCATHSPRSSMRRVR